MAPSSTTTSSQPNPVLDAVAEAIREVNVSKGLMIIDVQGDKVTAQIQKPVSPPSRWSKFIGWLTSGKADGYTLQMKRYTKQKELTVSSMAAFRKAVEAQYGAHVAGELQKTTLKNRRLDLGTVTKAIGSAKALAAHRQAKLDQFTSMLKAVLGSKQCEGVNDDVFRRLGELTLGRHLLAPTLRTGPTQAALREAERLFAGLDRNKDIQGQLDQLTNESRLANTIAKQLAESTKGASSPPVAADAEIRTLLHKLALTGKATCLTSPEIDVLSKNAVQLLKTLQATPGMSLPRARMILKFAAHAPKNRLGVAMDLCKPPSQRKCFDQRGVAAGSTFDTQLIPSTFRPFQKDSFDEANAAITKDGPALKDAAEDSRHQLTLGNFTSGDILRKDVAAPVALSTSSEASRTPATELPAAQAQHGVQISLHKQVLRDAVGADYVVQGKQLNRELGALVNEFHAAFGSQPHGDALAALVSSCANQLNISPIHVQMNNETFLLPGDGNHDVCHDVWKEPDGRWTVRTTLSKPFSSGHLNDTEIPMTPNTATMCTVEFTIDPGKKDGPGPRLVSIESDAVYVGGPAAAPPPQAS